MNKTVVISGASQGLGLILANTFSEHGWSTVAVGRSTRPEGMSQEVQYHQLDCADIVATQSFWQQLKSQTSSQEQASVCLVNNAGGYKGGLLQELMPEDYAEQMQSIYMSSVQMTRGLISNFSKAKIINMLSASAMTPLAENGAYGAAKTAAAHFFKSLQKQYPPEQYQITNLYPDKMATHGEDNSAMDPQQVADFILSQAESNSSYYLKDAYIYSLKH